MGKWGKSKESKQIEIAVETLGLEDYAPGPTSRIKWVNSVYKLVLLLSSYRSTNMEERLH